MLRRGDGCGTGGFVGLVRRVISEGGRGGTGLLARKATNTARVNILARLRAWVNAKE